jgi:hypothetical protein
MINKFLLFLLIIFSLISFIILGFTGYDLINIISEKLKDYYNLPYDKFYYFIIGIIIIILITNPNYYRSILGKIEFPCNLLNESIPQNPNFTYSIRTKPFTKIIYWGADLNYNTHMNYILSKEEAYDKYNNSGVTIADKNGLAILTLRKPQKFYTKILGLYKRDQPLQINYRESNDYGILSDIKTIFI